MYEQTFVVGENQTKSITIEKTGKYTVELAGPGAHADISGRLLLKGIDEANIEV